MDRNESEDATKHSGDEPLATRFPELKESKNELLGKIRQFIDEGKHEELGIFKLRLMEARTILDELTRHIAQVRGGREDERGRK